jgi:hypothetical protein
VDAETVRQLQREAGNRRADAEALRDAIRDRLGGGNVDFSDGLDFAIDRFRDLEEARAYADPRDLADLQQALVEALRELDFALRREFAAGDREGPMVAGSGDVPEQYRQSVEEYYRSLAGGNQR